jgi:hypothetical protein
MAKQKRRKKPPKRTLALPDLEQTKSAVLNTLTSKSGQRSYAHAIDEIVDWYCSEPRLALNRAVVRRHRIYLEERHLAPTTINLRLAAVRRVAYEAADSGLLSPELAAGIRRAKSVRITACAPAQCSKSGMLPRGGIMPGRSPLVHSVWGRLVAKVDRLPFAPFNLCSPHRCKITTNSSQNFQNRTHFPSPIRKSLISLTPKPRIAVPAHLAPFRRTLHYQPVPSAFIRVNPRPIPP